MKTFKWTVEFTVTKNWIEDGFDLTSERAHAMLASDLSYAYDHELGAKVTKAPDPELIAKTQGYKDAEEMHSKNPFQYEGA